MSVLQVPYSRPQGPRAARTASAESIEVERSLGVTEAPNRRVVLRVSASVVAAPAAGARP
jgi:hypothetical protein